MKVCHEKLQKEQTCPSLNLSFVDDDNNEEHTSHENPVAMNFISNNSDSETDDDDNCNSDVSKHLTELLEEMIDETELDELITDFEVEVPNTPVSPQLNWMVSLMTWLCMFLALWQYTFSVTDTALEHLIKFLKSFLNVMGQRSPDIATLAAFMPPSLYMFFRHIGCSTVKYEKYVICIKCFKLYNADDCITRIQGIPESKHCSNILFPNHPQRHHRKPCGQLLMMKYSTASGKTLLYPLKTYCYLPVQRSLQLLVTRKLFMENCELWRKRESFDGIYSDIYDGRIWKEFADPNGLNFFTEENNYGLMLNLDWFCPYKHVKSYSVGVIYAVITNLPRSERFKRENLLLIGIIPSMQKEPKTNTFLEPLIDELTIAWHRGFSYNVPHSTHNPITIRLALILVGCDIPACRKLCGFLGKIYYVYLLPVPLKLIHVKINLACKTIKMNSSRESGFFRYCKIIEIIFY